VVVVGVNTAEPSDPMARARRFRDQHRLTYPILVDEGNKAATAFGVEAFPTNVILDTEGKVRYLEAGFNPGAINATLRGLLEKKQD
jgi:peroxiredoxin